MTILEHNKDILIIGADTRKTAITILLGFIMLGWIVFTLLTSSPFFMHERIIPVATGIIIIMSFCMAYYFYRVFGKLSYIFDRKNRTLTIITSTILGSKEQKYQLDHIQSIEERIIPTYAYHGHADLSSDAYHTAKNENYYTTVVLHLSRKELNLVPNAAYFFLHPFNHLTDAVDNGLGKTLANFLKIPFVKQKQPIKS